MSLINEALKKAQKMRTQDQVIAMSPVPDGSAGPDAKGPHPMSTRLLVGIVAGAAVLVAGSVLATVILLRKPGTTPGAKPIATVAAVSETPSQTSAPSPSSALPASTPAPIVVAVAPPAAASVTAPVAPNPEVPTATASPVVNPLTPASTPPPDAAGTPPVASAALVPAVAPVPGAKFDVRAQAFVDAMHVTGIRASGSDSKVLMNDRVFRLNDIVERSLGLRLTGVAADQLSFTDGNGVLYTRNF
jgi:hypothetical protein